MSGVTKFIPSWIRKAHGLLGDATVPTGVGGGDAAPVYDPFQQGWGQEDGATAVWNEFVAQVGASTPAASVAFFEPDVQFGHLLVSALMVNGTAGFQTNTIQLTFGAAGTATQRLTFDLAAGAAGQGINNVPYVIIPPGFGLRADFPGTGVGESYFSSIVTGRFRAGYKFI